MNDLKEKKPEMDRVLGDEWENWSGNLDESITYNETARLFTVIASVALFLFLGILGVILYLIEPRLNLIHPILVYFARVTTIVLAAACTVLATLSIISVFTGRNLLYNSRIGQIAATRILPVTLAIAERLGIPRDRLGNSFVSFSNAIVRASYKPNAGKTIILLPRCLTPDMKKEVSDLGKRANIGVFTTTGGGQARRIILRERPSAVIGVACERDLMSGIHDVAPHMPTIGVANKRPQGPCKNTVIDIDELKQAIGTFTGKPLD